MKYEANKVLTFGDGSKYVIASTSIYDNNKYYYLVEVNEEAEDIQDGFKIVKEVEENGKVILKKVTEEVELETVSKFLANNLQ